MHLFCKNFVFAELTKCLPARRSEPKKWNAKKKVANTEYTHVNIKTRLWVELLLGRLDAVLGGHVPIELDVVFVPLDGVE